MSVDTEEPTVDEASTADSEYLGDTIGSSDSEEPLVDKADSDKESEPSAESVDSDLDNCCFNIVSCCCFASI